MSATLQRNFVDSARRRPAATAVVEPGTGSIRYDALDALSDRARDWLVGAGVGRGDRVGLFMRKSVDTVAALLGALKAGASYVPVDSAAPAARGAYILHNCEVKALVVEAELLPRLQAELSTLGAAPQVLAVSRGAGPGAGLAAALEAAGPQPATETVDSGADDLAYILYTSGSTGRPKGVMLTQRNAVSFVDWCSEVFAPREDDRLSSHAPFHFDLSILDLHLCFKHAATLVLVNEDIGKDAPRLARLIADERISIWYSAPSILALLAQFGDLVRHDYSALRQVLFAGEVFAVKHLRALGRQLPAPRYFNLYGPTETNVCTWYEVRMPVPEERTKPYPIGHVCSHLQARVLDEHGVDVARGSEGELCIAGPGVMQGYWSLPEQTAHGFRTDAAGVRWYRTGDIVTEADDGCYTYLGRRDRMVKRRGYRVELGEIEAALYKHPRVKEAAVVALPDADAGVTIVAHLAAHDGKPPGLIEMKRHCSENMPLYMIPDRFVWQPSLPKTSTDKIDYQGLKALG